MLNTTNESGKIANTILEQLGGNRFVAMTGAKNFLARNVGAQGYKGGLFFVLPAKNMVGANRVEIMLGYSDTYAVTFYKSNGTRMKPVKHFPEGVYVASLRRVFEETTGLRTRL